MNNRAGPHLDNSKRLVRHLELTSNAKLIRWTKPEPRVVVGMSHHEHGIDTQSSALIQTCADQFRSDSSALVRRENSHRRKREEQPFATVDPHSREADVTDDRFTVGCNEGHKSVLKLAKRVNEPRLSFAAEGSGFDRVNGCGI